MERMDDDEYEQHLIEGHVRMREEDKNVERSLRKIKAQLAAAEILLKDAKKRYKKYPTGDTKRRVGQHLRQIQPMRQRKKMYERELAFSPKMGDIRANMLADLYKKRMEAKK